MGQAYAELGNGGYQNGLSLAVYSGMLLGAIFWGISADIVGRRHAFNMTLMICSVATLIAGAMPTWPSLAFFIGVIGFGGGGNLIMDTTVFLEYLPSSKQWVLTFMAGWWGLGQAFTGLVAWGFLGRFIRQWPFAHADWSQSQRDGTAQQTKTRPALAPWATTWAGATSCSRAEHWSLSCPPFESR
jgi:MFS family permease